VAPNASKALSFNARGVCPVLQLDPAIASAVLDHRRQEQFKMAEYIAHEIPVVPLRDGIDGGMNPVFESKLTTDHNGQVYMVAGTTSVPGALPRNPANRGLFTMQMPRPARTSQPVPVVLASAPVPQPAPEPKEAEAPQQQQSSGVFSWFGGSQAQAEPAAPAAESEPVTLRGTNTEMAAKPKRAAPMRTASAPVVLHPNAQEAAPRRPTAVASNAPAPAPTPAVLRVSDDQKAPTPAPEMRTAYSAPPPSNNDLLTGAQPVVPASSFESRWTALR
jgi:hypothetical protein